MRAVSYGIEAGQHRHGVEVRGGHPVVAVRSDRTSRGFTLSWQSGQSVAALRASRRANQSSDDMFVSLAVLDVMLDRLEVDHAASESVSGSILSGQSALVSSHQPHSKTKCNLLQYFLALDFDCHRSHTILKD